MSYRANPDGYDINKWWSNEQRRRVRRPYTRWLLLFGMVLVAAWPIGLIATGNADDRALPSMPLLLPLMIGASLSPFARENWLTAHGRAKYDEFERDAFARSTIWAYTIFLAVVTAAFGYFWASQNWGWSSPRGAGEWSACGITTLIIGIALPLTVAEFLVPLPPGGDDFD